MRSTRNGGTNVGDVTKSEGEIETNESMCARERDNDSLGRGCAWPARRSRRKRRSCRECDSHIQRIRFAWPCPVPQPHKETQPSLIRPRACKAFVHSFLDDLRVPSMRVAPALHPCNSIPIFAMRRTWMLGASPTQENIQSCRWRISTV